MEDYAKKARDLFEGGYNCAQASYGAFCQVLGEDFELAMQRSAPFGGGLGKMGEVCGALSGMLMAYGVYSGGYELQNLDDKAAYYAQVRRLCQRFEKQFGSVICRELLALPRGSDDAPSAEKTASAYTRRPCVDFVQGAVRILMEAMEATEATKAMKAIEKRNNHPKKKQKDRGKK